MKTIGIYATMGLLAHEKQPVYTTSPASELSDKVTIEWPEDLPLGHNAAGELLVSIGSSTYRLDDLLVTGKDDAPCLRWYDGQTTRFRALRVVG